MNLYCEALGIEVPSLRELKGHSEANTFSLLIVALLEHGGPLSLSQVAGRFEGAGVAPADRALRSLQRCRPDRHPVVRDGDLYALDPHHDQADLWAFRLGLRPPRIAPLRLVPPDPAPLPGADAPLSAEELREAFEDAHLWSWSAQRLAVAILDAHGGRLAPAAAVAALGRFTRGHPLREGSLQIRRGSPISEENGIWVLDPEHPAVIAARDAVRGRVVDVRRRRAAWPSASEVEVQRRRYEAARAERGIQLARLRRVLVHTFPPDDPAAVVLIDLATREISTFLAGDASSVPARLEPYDVIAGVHVRNALRSLGFEPGGRRLAELGPPQKSRTLDRRGRTLRITLPLLVTGSCGISRPFAEPDRLSRYLDEGATTRLRRRLEADAKSLFALHSYGRLHGAVRLRWGFLDEMLPAPWVYRHEPTLHDLEREAQERALPLEVVIGSAPGWTDPWARAVTCVVRRHGPYQTILLDHHGFPVDRRDIQLARLAQPR
jgi:hypothetical protein